MLTTSKPEDAKRMLKEAQQDVNTRWRSMNIWRHGSLSRINLAFLKIVYILCDGY